MARALHYITEYLVNHTQYLPGMPQDYDKVYCLDNVQSFAFLEATQPATLAAIPQPNTLNETAVQKYIFTRPDGRPPRPDRRVFAACLRAVGSGLRHAVEW